MKLGLWGIFFISEVWEHTCTVCIEVGEHTCTVCIEVGEHTCTVCIEVGGTYMYSMY